MTALVRGRDPAALDLRDMRPVFIGGIYRSGTSLMAAILGNHPNLAIAPRDRNWWTMFYARYHRVRRDRGWQTFLDEFFSTYKTRMLGQDGNYLRREADTFEIGDFARVFALVLSAYAANEGKPRWGEKTPFSHRFADRIFATFPEARFIHMLRDPRDVFASMRQARFTTGLHYWLTASVAWVTMDWNESVRLAARNQSRYCGRYMTVRYEKLVANPESIMRRVSDFLDEPFYSERLTTSGYPFKGGGDSNSAFEDLQGISTASVGRYRSVLPPNQIWLCERLVGRRLHQHGYEQSNVALRGSESLRFFGYELPATGARIIVWRCVRLIRAILPRPTERKAPNRPPRGSLRVRQKIRQTTPES